MLTPFQHERTLQLLGDSESPVGLPQAVAGLHGQRAGRRVGHVGLEGTDDAHLNRRIRLIVSEPASQPAKYYVLYCIGNGMDLIDMQARGEWMGGIL